VNGISRTVELRKRRELTLSVFHGWKKCYREVTMKTLLDQEIPVEGSDFGPDPILMKKRGLPYERRNIAEFKKKIQDMDYMDHAIDRIALELMHFIAR
jgi:hypothetical protein